MSKLDSLLSKNRYWQHLINWYERRPSRDKTILQLLSVAMVGGLLYFLAWTPLTEWTNEQKQNFLYQEEMHRWLHNNLAKAQTLNASQITSPKHDLSSSAASSAKQADVTLARV